MVMDTRIRDFVGRVATEVKAKASNAALARTADSDGANMVENPAWKDVSPTTGLPAGWSRAGSQSAASIVQIAALAGSVWKFDAAASSVGAYSPFFDVYPGEVYDLSASFRGALSGLTSFTMRVEYRDRSDAALSSFNATVNFPGQDVNGSTSQLVTIPANAVRARILVFHAAGGTGSWYLSSLSFRRAIPEIVSGYLSDASLKSLYVVHRAKSGGEYPVRISGAVNLFIGDTDPGLLMSGNDIWANPANATYAGVAAAIIDTGSDIRKAIQSDSIYIPVTNMISESDTTTPAVVLGSSPNQRIARTLPKTAVSRLFSSLKIPNTWNTMRVKPHWQHTTTSAVAGDVAWFFNLTTTPFNSGTTTGTFYLPNSGMNIIGNGQSTPMTIPVGNAWSFTMGRNSGAPGDTFNYPIQLLGVELSKAS